MTTIWLVDWRRKGAELVQLLDFGYVGDLRQGQVVERHGCALDRTFQMGGNGVMCYLRSHGDFDDQQVLGGVGNAELAEGLSNLRSSASVICGAGGFINVSHYTLLVGLKENTISEWTLWDFSRLFM